MKFELWLEFEQWVTYDHHDAYNDSFFATILLEDGREYALNVWTFEYLNTARLECQETGECLGGQYLDSPDLFVEKLDRELMEKVVAQLINDDALSPAWRVPLEE